MSTTLTNLDAAVLAALALCRNRTYLLGDVNITGVRGRTLSRALGLDIGWVNGSAHALAEAGLVYVHETDDEYIYALLPAGRAALCSAEDGVWDGGGGA